MAEWEPSGEDLPGELERAAEEIAGTYARVGSPDAEIVGQAGWAPGQ
jgi:hypothetical protein